MMSFAGFGLWALGFGSKGAERVLAVNGQRSTVNFLSSGLVLACVTALAGCMTAQTYDGPRRPSGEVAHISGDYLITAGAPITLIIRMIDGKELSMSQSAVEVLPGTHTLLVDCRIQETKSVTRHTIEVEVFAGQRYRLVADTGPALRECTAVRLEGVY